LSVDQEEKVEPLEAVGKSVPRVDAKLKVSGGALFCDDILMPGMLVGRAMRSPYPHARILKIDTSRAQRVKGVIAIITGRDMIARLGGVIEDQYIVAVDVVRYPGEPVAALAAVDEDTAQEAVQLIEVEYQELPGLFEPEKAMEPGAPLVHERINQYKSAPGFKTIKDSNICSYFKLRSGDVEEGFKQSQLICEDRFSTPMIQHTPLECHVGIAQWDPAGKLTLWASSQGPFTMRAQLAAAFKLPMSKVRVISHYVGGGFGSKSSVKTCEGMAAALARKTKGRPVKMVFSRSEEFGTSVVRQPTIIDLKTGVSKEGKILARQVRLLFDTGAYSDSGPVCAKSAGCGAAGPYDIANVKIDSYCVYTNKPIGAPFRGFGVPQIAWALESQMDMLAEGLAMDPLELRMRNLAEEGTIYPSGQRLDHVGVKEALIAVAKGIEWDKRVPGRGKGIACIHKTSSTPAPSGAFVKINEDGSAAVLTGGIEMGQGYHTVACQMAAQVLGIPVDAVTLAVADTDIVPFDNPTVGSRASFGGGEAVRRAAVDARAKLFAAAAQILEANPEDLAAKEGKIFVKGSPEKSVPLAQANRVYQVQKGGPVLGCGSYTPESFVPFDPETGQSEHPTEFWMYGAQAVEVKVDEETGKVSVLKVSAYHDAGRVINPVMSEGQIEGGVIMGLSTSLWEELCLNNGKAVNANLADYKLSTALDVPEIGCGLIELAHPRGPFGAKGMGEPTNAGTAPALANAIYAASRVRIKELPLTQEKLLIALKKRNQHQLSR
jgi:carbon-monoxide dehydrogenase large subunit